MQKLFRRPILAFALGASLAGFAAAGTAAYAALSDDRVTACYAPKSGSLYVVGRDGASTSCLAGHTAIDWSVVGPQGPPGVFSGVLKSKSGAYSLSVTDEGIVLAGPGAKISLVGGDVRVDATGATIQATGNLGLTSGAATSVQAGTGIVAASGGSTSLAVGKDLTVTSSGAASLSSGKDSLPDERPRDEPPGRQQPRSRERRRHDRRLERRPLPGRRRQRPVEGRRHRDRQGRGCHRRGHRDCEPPRRRRAAERRRGLRTADEAHGRDPARPGRSHLPGDVLHHRLRRLSLSL